MENEFDPDLSKQAQEAIFSRKIRKLLHSTLLFNNIPFSNLFISETPWFNIRYKIKLLGTYKKNSKKN